MMAWENAAAARGTWSWMMALLLAASIWGCADGGTGPGDTPMGRNLCPDPNAESLELFDADGDTIADPDDGLDDVDGDGIPNFQDEDSDGDGLLDIDEAGDAFCATRPVDLDLDGIPDFLDADANGDGISELMPDDVTSDIDDDGTPDYLDVDIDGDGIPNRDELGEDGEAVDSDFDGTPDFLDLDSDSDSIFDRNEGLRDVDGDGIPSFRDLDSDGDGINDTTEAGDTDLETPPRTCDAELAFDFNPQEGGEPVFESDGFPDYLDADSDNDGLTDGQEESLATNACGWDTDGDGFSDLVEAAFERVGCAAGPDAEDARGCGCATDETCGIPEDDFFVVLPFNGDPVKRDLTFGTTIRQADVFFVTDSTCSMGTTISNVQDTAVELIERINESIPDAWFGGGEYRDFPGFGGSLPGVGPFRLASQMQPSESRELVQEAFEEMSAGGGAGPASMTEALYQIFTGEGGTFTRGGDVFTLPNYVDECLEGGFGAPCFRSAALQVIIMVADTCTRAGPPGETVMDGCVGPYTDIVPAPHSWNSAMLAMNRFGAKFIGVNASTSQPECGLNPDPATGTQQPCYFLVNTAEVTSSVDVAREPLVFDLDTNSASNDLFLETLVAAVDRLATRVPLDVDTTIRDDPNDPELVDARDFIKASSPACRYNRLIDGDTLPEDLCWTSPEDVDPRDSVAFIDSSTFFDIIPGTQVTFEVTFQNTTFRPVDTAKVFVAFIDVRGDGSAVLDTRQVTIVIPGGGDPGVEFDEP